MTASQAEDRMLELLAAARTEAHVAPLTVDADLSALARSHSEDMAEHGFVGHVSQTTGTTEDRFRSANIHVPLLGENVAQGQSPEAASASLMESPAHRANMIEPRFTHVGIGVSVRYLGKDPLYFVTILFARKPAPRR
jgi:uncharacterized protein YkwD